MNILAIESAVTEGSIAIIRNSGPALVHHGNGASRAERILPIISELIERAGISKHQLDLIAVSTGPGSYSGIRIGMSTGLGLRDALGIPCIGIPVLAAMASVFATAARTVCAVPVGKNDIGWQLFDTAAGATSPRLTSMATFVALLPDLQARTLFAPGEVLGQVKSNVPGIVCSDAGTNLAEYIGRLAESRVSTNDSMHPIYLRNQDGPARAF